MPVPLGTKQCVLRRLLSMGLLVSAGHGRYRITNAPLAEACRELAADWPDAHDIMAGPTSLAILAALPDTGGAPRPWEVAGVTHGGYHGPARRMENAGVLDLRHGTFVWAAETQVVQRVAAAYRALHMVPPGKASADGTCIHQRGIEAAWAGGAMTEPGCVVAGASARPWLFPKHPDWPSVVYRGPRDLDDLDHVMLQLRSTLGLAQGLKASADTVPDLLAPIAQSLNIELLVDGRVASRFKFYGLEALLPRLRKMLYGRIGVPGMAAEAPWSGRAIELPPAQGTPAFHLAEMMRAW